MVKVVVAGTSGSGKTTLANKIALLKGCQATDLDDLYWLPGWVQRNEGEFERLIQEVVKQDSWVISGNCSRMAHHTWPKADLVVWLDYPLPTLLWRAFKRSFRRIYTGETCCNGNMETIRRFFSTQGIFWWILKSYKRRKREFSRLCAEGKMRRISCKAEEEQFLKSL